MDAPLTVAKTKPWTNTPENRDDLEHTSLRRALARKQWASRQVEAALIRTQPTQGPS